MNEWNSELFTSVWKRVSGQEIAGSRIEETPAERLWILCTAGRALYAGLLHCRMDERTRQSLLRLFRENGEALREIRAICYLKGSEMSACQDGKYRQSALCDGLRKAYFLEREMGLLCREFASGETDESLKRTVLCLGKKADYRTELLRRLLHRVLP